MPAKARCTANSAAARTRREPFASPLIIGNRSALLVQRQRLKGSRSISISRSAIEIVAVTQPHMAVARADAEQRLFQVQRERFETQFIHDRAKVSPRDSFFFLLTQQLLTL